MKLTVLVAVLLGTVACAAIDRAGMRETHQRNRTSDAIQDRRDRIQHSRDRLSDALQKDTVPICVEGSDCKAQWEAAQRWILQNLQWKIQNVSDVYIETFGPGSDDTATAMRIVKEPIGGGRFRLEAKPRCGIMVECFPDLADAFLSFNRYVTSFALDTRTPGDREKNTAAAPHDEAPPGTEDPLARGTELFTVEGNLIGTVESAKSDSILVALKSGGTVTMTRTQAMERIKR
jgi:hypothetical protein